nr:hypothetical protein [Tanacetum cinerariifolium]
APTIVASLTFSAPTFTPSTIATISTVPQAPTPPTTALSTLLQDLPNFGSLFGFDHQLKTLEINFSEFVQANQFAGAVSSIPGIVQRYMDQRMNEAVKTVNEQLKAEVLTRPSNSSKTSYAVTADLSKMELKNILIKKMEGNKSIHRSDEQRNLYKALVEACESDKIILDAYGDIVMLKRRRDDDADKDKDPPLDQTEGPRGEKKERSQNELMQTTQELEEPSHQEFEIGAADDQPIMDVPAPTTVASLTWSAPTLTPSTIPIISTVRQAPTPPTTASSTLVQDLPNFGSLFGFDHRLKTLESNFSEFMQTNQFAGAVFFILGIVQRYMNQWMNEASSSVSSQFVTSMLNPSPNAGIDSLFETTSQMDVSAPTTVASRTWSAPTLTPSTIPTISTVRQAPTPPTIAPSTLVQDLPNFGSLFGFDHRLKTLESNFSEFMQTNQFAGAVFSILGIVQRYMDQWMNEAVKVTIQIQSGRLCDEAQVENEEFLKNIDENIQKIIKEQVKEQVKVQVSKILPKIEKTVNEQLEAKVLTRSSNSSKTSYAVTADLSKMELKKILIEKMEDNKSIHRFDEQRNLYKALVEACESDKIILGTYGDIVMLKRRRDDDANKDEEPSAGSDRGSKRRREGKEPELTSAPREKVTRTIGRIITVTELKIVEWHNYKHLDWITMRRDDDKLYKFKEGDYKRLCIRGIEDMLLLLVQGKLTNLMVEERFAFNVSLRMFTRSIVIQRHMKDL